MEMESAREFQCCICGLEVKKALIHRELALCPSCGSNARLRGVALGILRTVFQDFRIPLSRQPRMSKVAAIGMSDHDCYSGTLSNLLSYRNTYLHQEPRLDLCDPRSVAGYNELDLIVCSDVIEHTKEPPKVVLRRLRQMLASSGVVILSAPTYWMSCNIEWYSGASRIDVLPRDGSHVVIWSTIIGNQYLDLTPSFHGGPGEVLEMRVISHDALIADARAEGLDVSTLEFAPELGYGWPIQNDYPGLDAAMDGRVLVLRHAGHPTYSRFHAAAVS